MLARLRNVVAQDDAGERRKERQRPRLSESERVQRLGHRDRGGRRHGELEALGGGLGVQLGAGLGVPLGSRLGIRLASGFGIRLGGGLGVQLGGGRQRPLAGDLELRGNGQAAPRPAVHHPRLEVEGHRLQDVRQERELLRPGQRQAHHDPGDRVAGLGFIARGDEPDGHLQFRAGDRATQRQIRQFLGAHRYLDELCRPGKLGCPLLEGAQIYGDPNLPQVAGKPRGDLQPVRRTEPLQPRLETSHGHRRR
ncbi:hypothetical protein ETD96_00455 [Actinomadura geliboluensis]|uniref:Uncharacterized protein n=1 Tax=Actinomadura geliboluensis TaxID=882440 RepID=A0A5S4HCP4_9ACTN|nr:hypothetical protein ETD96_00455 [Actinomadura geliboluensis]